MNDKHIYTAAVTICTLKDDTRSSFGELESGETLMHTRAYDL